MNAASNLASRKLVVALAGILAIALNTKLGLMLATEDVAGIVTITMCAIGAQGSVDLADRAMPVIASWLSGKLPGSALVSACAAALTPSATAPAPVPDDAPGNNPTPPAAPHFGVLPGKPWDRPADTAAGGAA